jgi:hypothetical protein
MSYNELIMKILDGVKGVDERSYTIATFGLIVEAYKNGRLDDDGLMKTLTELCFDVLLVKDTTGDIDQLKAEAAEWAKKFYKAIRLMTVRDRYSGLIART